MARSAHDPARTVRTVFAVALLVVFVPSRLMAWAHGAGIAQLSGASVSALLVWWFLYRLCMRSDRQGWFTAIAIPALYVAVFAAPLYAWGTLAVLAIVHRGMRRSIQDTPRTGSPPAAPPPPPDDADTALAQDQLNSAVVPSIQIVDLDRVCTPYRRILFSQRVVRAAAAAAAGSALLAGPAVLFFGVIDYGDPILGGVLGILMTLFLALVGALFFSWLRAIWRGSVRAAQIGLVVITIVGLMWISWATMAVDREIVVNGKIWYHVAAYALQLGLLGVMAMGSATVVRRRDDVVLMGVLRQNATRSWHVAVLQLAGVVLPGGRSWRALLHKSVVLSTLAFCIEGLGFYVYFRAAGNILRVPELLDSPYPGSLTPLEGHFFSLVTVACLIMPVMYVSTQLTLAAGGSIRNAARRASVRSAEDLLEEDRRSSVLFLRDFRDDQVSLDRGVMPGWIREIDPGLEQANLEDVLQACLSVGPLVAIGRPEDVAPPIGAARRYVRNDDWKGAALSMMKAAGLVVVGASESAGLTWEVGQLRDQGHLAKCVFVMPPSRARLSLRLAGRLMAQLLPVEGVSENGSTAAELMRAIGVHHLVGLTLRHGLVTAYVTDRSPSQVEFDVTLRLALGSVEER